MTFPLLNISACFWTGEEDPLSLILFSPYIYTTDKEVYEKYFLHQRYVDCKGDIFIIEEIRKPKSLFRKLLKFLPNVYKVELLFTKTGKKMIMNEVKKYLLNKISLYKPDENLTQWIERIQNAKTFEELYL